MFRIRIRLYSLDQLPEAIAECKRRGLTQNFSQEPEAVIGDWMNEHRSMNTTTDVRIVQQLFGVTISMDVQ